MKHRFAGSVVLSSIVSGLILTGCAVASDPSPDARAGRTSSAVIRGVPSDASQDAVVLLVQVSSKGGLCTGTLIAPNLVLTARHCVANTDEGVACFNGEPADPTQPDVRGNVDPKRLYVFKGSNRPDFYSGNVEPDGQGALLFDTKATTLCNNDIAVILLASPIEGASIAQLRLDAPPTTGETITSVGWGVSEKTDSPAVRQQRKGVKIAKVGTPTTRGQLSSNEFQVGESICQGDSGGPALAEPSGAVIGVVSRGGNGKKPTQKDPSIPCINASNLYTQIAPFKATIMKAFEAAGYEPWLEGQPDPRLAPFGGECGGDADCQSKVCLGDGTTSTCTQSCDGGDGAACPEGFECTSPSGAPICTPMKPATQSAAGATANGEQSGGGCSASPTPARENGPLFVGLFFATFALATRLRRARR